MFNCVKPKLKKKTETKAYTDYGNDMIRVVMKTEEVSS